MVSVVACMSAVCENGAKKDFFGFFKYNCKVGVGNKKKMSCVLAKFQYSKTCNGISFSNSCVVSNGFCSVDGWRSGTYSGSARQGKNFIFNLIIFLFFWCLLVPIDYRIILLS